MSFLNKTLEAKYHFCVVGLKRSAQMAFMHAFVQHGIYARDCTALHSVFKVITLFAEP